MTNAIEIRGLNKTFGPKRAVQNLDLDVPEGSLYGFIGPNGAGKSTTIRMIMSIIFPDSGELRVLGKSSAVESKDRIGYLPEERGIYKKMKVGAFLKYIARLKGLDSAEADKRTKEWLVRVGLADTYRKKCEELSKGMQQKVQFVASVIHEPDLLILDEVFTGLDPENRRLMRELIREQNDAGRTIIFSTHAMFEAEQLCDRLFMIRSGEKVLDMPMEEIWRTYDPKTVVVEPIDASDIQKSWGSLPSVKEVVETDGIIELRLIDNADVGELMRQAASMAPVRRLELKRPSLEDVFIELVGGDAAAIRKELRSNVKPSLQEVSRG
ncbi:MAG: ATP-binding cassette domain-containing protein [Phycisphaeraceae bacterium]|nr:ATP-binding cassette domain-containing protein [Phycisphaeraceae bacterium]